MLGSLSRSYQKTKHKKEKKPQKIELGNARKARNIKYFTHGPINQSCPCWRPLLLCEAPGAGDGTCPRMTHSSPAGKPPSAGGEEGFPPAHFLPGRFRLSCRCRKNAIGDEGAIPFLSPFCFPLFFCLFNDFLTKVLLG